MNYKKHKTALQKNGYSIVSGIYSDTEIGQILSYIENAGTDGNSFLKAKGLFAIRQLMNVIPKLREILFNQQLTELLSFLFGTKFFLTKAIYFDKPIASNWFVAYHQDLSISVDRKSDLENYVNWTFKRGQYGVQPPVHILQNTITARIHLDDTGEMNGALKVIPKSHLKGIYRPEEIDWSREIAQLCEVEKGGVMLMKPLTFHASGKTGNKMPRRVLHLEFCNQELAEPLKWVERVGVLS